MKPVINKLFTIYFLSVLIICTTAGCKDDSGANEPQIPEPEPQIGKSTKRGLSYNLKDTADLEALKGGVSWWYNWYFETEAPEGYYEDYDMEFIPMLWGGNVGQARGLLIDFILEHPEIEYLLVLNEPNLKDQANRTPEQAAVDWLVYEDIIAELKSLGRSVYLVGPQMNWGTMPGFGDPVKWLDAFYEAYQTNNDGRDPLIDYLAFHWYDYGLKGQLDRLQKYGKKIWITEMANWNPQINSYQKQVDQMREMVALCESREDVFRYAWFIGRGGYPDNRFTYLFEEDPGVLTQLGKLYISLPFEE